MLFLVARFLTKNSSFITFFVFFSCISLYFQTLPCFCNTYPCFCNTYPCFCNIYTFVSAKPSLVSSKDSRISTRKIPALHGFRTVIVESSFLKYFYLNAVTSPPIFPGVCNTIPYSCSCNSSHGFCIIFHCFFNIFICSYNTFSCFHLYLPYCGGSPDPRSTRHHYSVVVNPFASDS